MKKRIIRLLLAVVMIVGMIPIGIISSFAENTEVVQYRSLDVSAGAYIDTGFIPTSKTMVIFEAEVGKTQNGAAVFGVCYYADGNNYSFHVNSNQTNFGTGFGPRMSWANAPIRNGLQSIQLDTNLLTLDGKEVTYPDPDPSDPNYPKNIKEETYTFDHTKNGGLPLYLFAINFFGNEVQTFPEQFIRFYSCKIYDDYNLVREYVPARCGSEFGVYDRVEKNSAPNRAMALW